jgi:NTP pyrophosphatase (non-canonical NTP hydrolase)
MSKRPSVDELLDEIVAFRNARDWEKFHSVRNLVTALAVEVGELQELFLWKQDIEVDALLQDASWKQKLRHELADVFIYTMLLALASKNDVGEIVREKLAHNEEKYPAELAKGRAVKYTEL